MTKSHQVSVASTDYRQEQQKKNGEEGAKKRPLRGIGFEHHKSTEDFMYFLTKESAHVMLIFSHNPDQNLTFTVQAEDKLDS